MASYSETLAQVILATDAVPLVESVRVPVHLVIGENDPVLVPVLLPRLARDNDHVPSPCGPPATTTSY